MRQVSETHRAICKPKSPPTGAFWRLGRFHFLFAPILALVWLVLATPLRADTLSGTVKDPSGGSAAALDLAARLSWLIRWCKPVRFGRLTPYAWLSQCRRGA